jgi:SAM-dependent methyltransferase
MTSAYLEDLAFIHDDAFGHIATGAAKTIAAKLTERGLNQGLIVELACGSGISSTLLASAGYDIHGFDISPQMIELAEARIAELPEPPLAFPPNRKPETSFEVASLYDVEIPPCIAVTGIGEAFNYLFDPRASFESMIEVCKKAHQALIPGGILMFDFAQPGRALPRLEHHVWRGEGWEVTSETIESPPTRRLERRIVTNRAGRQAEELHELALYDHEETYAALKAIGFAPLTLASYAEDYRFGAGHGAFLAVKPFAQSPIS